MPPSTCRTEMEVNAHIETNAAAAEDSEILSTVWPQGLIVTFNAKNLNGEIVTLSYEDSCPNSFATTLYLSGVISSGFKISLYNKSVIWFVDGIPFAPPREGQTVDVLFRDPLFLRLQLFLPNTDTAIDFVDIELLEPVTPQQLEKLVDDSRSFFEELDAGNPSRAYRWDDEWVADTYHSFLQTIEHNLNSGAYVKQPRRDGINCQWDDIESLLGVLEQEFQFKLVISDFTLDLPNRRLYAHRSVEEQQKMTDFHLALFQHLEECNFILLQ